MLPKDTSGSFQGRLDKHINEEDRWGPSLRFTLSLHIEWVTQPISGGQPPPLYGAMVPRCPALTRGIHCACSLKGSPALHWHSLLPPHNGSQRPPLPHISGAHHHRPSATLAHQLHTRHPPHPALCWCRQAHHCRPLLLTLKEFTKRDRDRHSVPGAGHNHSSATLQPLSSHSSATLQPLFSHLQPLSSHSPATLQPIFGHSTATLQPLFSHSSATLQPLFGHSSAALQPLVSNSPATLQPLSSHSPATLQPLSSDSSANLRPLFSHSPATFIHSPAILQPFSSHSPATLQPLSSHSSATLQALSSHSSANLRPLSSHSQPLSSHSLTTLQPLSNHSPATLQPLSSHSPSTLRPHFNHSPRRKFYHILNPFLFTSIIQKFTRVLSSPTTPAASGKRVI
ncbi:uncharacterized protein LOC123502795 [Portunus trituberculatus]|uniref:uncharacterized protein LOC123502795 n=1 Tax=Portunus trituberculatus TaxID=210409 RepID=UPI001E1D2033|nr:uncharacterized protein LOC123502795 [Portunus trituberculatus]